MIQNAKFSGYYFYMNANIWKDFQIERPAMIQKIQNKEEWNSRRLGIVKEEWDSRRLGIVKEEWNSRRLGIVQHKSTLGCSLNFGKT